MLLASEKETIKMLIDAGADINIKDKENGNTPLMWAAFKGNVEAVKLLLSAKANVNLKNKKNETAYTIAVNKGNQEVADLIRLAGTK